MAKNEDRLSVALPEALRVQFAQVERRLWRVETAIACGTAIGALMLSFLAVFVSDRFWDTPGWLRWGLWLAGLAAAGLAGAVWARRWLWRRRDLRSLANLVQKKYSRLGDRLLGIVELANEERHNANFSPALYHAAIHQVADEARNYDFAQSVSSRGARRTALGAAALACGLAALFAVLSRPAWNALLRWATPMSDVPRFTLVTLEDLPKELIVAHGEAFDIGASVHYRSFWKPRRAFALWARQPAVESGVEGGHIHLHIPGQIENGVLEVRVGDARAEVKVLPAYRPSLQELAAQIQPPDYLQYPAQSQVLQSGSLLAVEGSKISFRGKVSRDLSSALMRSGEEKTAPLKIEGDSFVTGQTQPDALSEFTFNWQDKLGLTNAAPLRLSVQMQPDAPPVPEIADMPRDVFVLNSDVLSIDLKARDDFGVRDLGLDWAATGDSPKMAVGASEVRIQTPNAQTKETQRAFAWSPAMYRIPVDSTVEMTGFARDFYPERERSRTAVYRIRVLSPEEHAEMVRRQLEGLMSQVEEVTRLQEKVVAGLAGIKDADKLTPAEKSARLDESKQDQEQNAANLNDLAKQGESAVREAMKNPVFNEETIRQWSESMRQWQNLSQQKMPDAASAMQDAKQSSGSQPQKMDDAMQKAEDILNDLAKMESKANQHLDNLQALTLAQRLSKVGGEEKDISRQLFESASNTVGLLPRQLPEKEKLFENGLSTGQSQAQKQTTVLQSELSRFFERTQKKDYGEVSQQMKDTRAADELDRLGGLIDNNIGLEASASLGQWSERFQKWAEKLQPKSPSNSGSGSGSGGQQQKNDLTEQLIGLLRLREGEATLREQTGVLDQDRGAPDSYQQRAGTLASTQEKMAAGLDGIHQKTPLPQLDPAFADAAGAMKGVLDLLHQPQTGKPADAAESKTVDSLSDLINLINEQAQRASPKSSPGKSSSSAEEMQFLMKMAGNPGAQKSFAAQPARGLNNAGGSASGPGGPLSGNAAGKGANARTVGQSAGAIQNAPAEFRDALENYYHGLEKSEQ
ncbi:MAG TPA: hypothetical protein VGO59_02880 [Verrucomicrobiae bacterium]|jgi:hypothetical protein